MFLSKEKLGHYSDIQKVLAIVLLLNWGVALAKVIFGLLSHSSSMTADGWHSFSDGASNIVGLTGVAFASRPRDEDHPYGHKKFETFFSLGIAFMLGLLCFELVQSGVSRLHTPGKPDVSWVSFVVMLATMGVNIIVMKYEEAKGHQLRSDILLSDAKHTRADILTSMSVLVSLFAVQLGFPIMDAIVTLVIALFIAYAAYGIVADACKTLCDEAVIKDISQVTEVVMGVPGVRFCHKIRSRGRSDDINLDLHVHLDPDLSVKRSHALSHEIERQLKQALPDVSDVIIHIEPAAAHDGK